jgi:hypothetical protein
MPISKKIIKLQFMASSRKTKPLERARRDDEATNRVSVGSEKHKL